MGNSITLKVMHSIAEMTKKVTCCVVTTEVYINFIGFRNL